jgi:hypothetical protein
MTTQVAHSTIEQLRATMPGQSIDWYIRIGQLITEGKMPMPVMQKATAPVQVRLRVEEAKPIAVKPPKPVPPPPKPSNLVSEATKAQLLELCRGNLQSAERLVKAERFTAYSEEMAWSRAYEKLMVERMNLYANISYNT